MGIGEVRRRAVFLDRDGVINRIVMRDGAPVSPRNVEEFVFNDGVREAVDELKKLGYMIIVATNQPDLARKKISRKAIDRMTERTKEEIAVDAFYMCPHDDEDNCPCRKPRPGMLLQAAQEWDIDLQASFMIGDTWKDTEAARGAGCRAILLDAPYNQEAAADFRVRSLSEAVRIIGRSGDPLVRPRD